MPAPKKRRPQAPPVGLRIPPDTLARIDALAKANGITRHRWILDAITLRLDARELSDALDRLRRVLG